MLVASKIRLQKLFDLAGYRVERNIDTTQPIDVFDLAVRKTVAERGADFFFVQIGAHDGSRSTRFAHIEEFHWSGVSVEPQPHVFEQRRRNYASEMNLRFVKAAVACARGHRKLYTVASDGAATSMASFDRALLGGSYASSEARRLIGAPGAARLY